MFPAVLIVNTSYLPCYWFVNVAPDVVEFPIAKTEVFAWRIVNFVNDDPSSAEERYAGLKSANAGGSSPAHHSSPVLRDPSRHGDGIVPAPLLVMRIRIIERKEGASQQL